MVQFLCKQSLEKKQEAVKKGQSRDTFNIVYKRRHRTKNNKTKNTTQKTKNIEQHGP
jgi:superoxide dismutase